jgi:hypothetical protein
MFVGTPNQGCAAQDSMPLVVRLVGRAQWRLFAQEFSAPHRSELCLPRMLALAA